MEPKESKKYSVVIGGALLLLALVALLCWHRANGFVSGHDATGHMKTTLWVAHAMEDHPFSVAYILRDQPARYTPLTYVLSASMLLLTGYSYWGYVLPIVIFWVLACLALFVAGFQFSQWRWSGLFCLAVLLANPTTWTVGMDLNLEASLLAGCVLVFAMILFADRISSLAMVGALLLAALFAFSKSVILVPVVPFAALLLLTKDKKLLTKRALILLAVVASVGYWFLSRPDKVLPEMSTDFQNVVETGLPGPFYYPLLLLIGFRGLPLLCGLGYLFWIRYREKELTITDFGILAFFAAPYVFFSFFDTKREWYLIAPYIALPVLYAYGANRKWESRLVRRISSGLLIFFSLLAFINTGIVLTISGPKWYNEGHFHRLRPAKPPSEMETRLVDSLTTLLAKDPKAKIAVDLTKDDQPTGRIQAIMTLGTPSIKVFGQIVTTDRALQSLEQFVQAVPESRWLVSIGASWPNFSPLQEFYPAEKLLALTAKMDSLQSLFGLKEKIALSDGGFISVFENMSGQQTEAVVGSVRYDRLSGEVRRYKEAKDWEGALSAIEELRKTIGQNQLAGVNLEEAMVLSHLGRHHKAQDLLKANLKDVKKTDSIFSESAFFLSHVLADQNLFSQGTAAFQTGLLSNYDESNMVDATLYLVARMRKAKELLEADRLLALALKHAQGENRPILMIEQAKVSLEKGDEAKCRALFAKAYKLSSDPFRKAWIVDVLEEIDRVGFGKMVLD